MQSVNISSGGLQDEWNKGESAIGGGGKEEGRKFPQYDHYVNKWNNIHQNNKPTNMKKEFNEVTNWANRFKNLRFWTLALSQSDSKLGILGLCGL